MALTKQNRYSEGLSPYCKPPFLPHLQQVFPELILSPLLPCKTFDLDLHQEVKKSIPLSQHHGFMEPELHRPHILCCTTEAF